MADSAHRLSFCIREKDVKKNVIQPSVPSVFVGTEIVLKMTGSSSIASSGRSKKTLYSGQEPFGAGSVAGRFCFVTRIRCWGATNLCIYTSGHRHAWIPLFSHEKQSNLNTAQHIACKMGSTQTSTNLQENNVLLSTSTIIKPLPETCSPSAIDSSSQHCLLVLKLTQDFLVLHAPIPRLSSPQTSVYLCYLPITGNNI